MRISTHQFFQRGVSAVTDITQQTQSVQQQISSGERLQSAADDPAAATRIIKLEAELDVGEQYSRNMDLAENRLQLIESSVTSIETAIQRVRELVVQAGGGSLTNADRNKISVEISERVKEIADLVNTRDRDNSHIFGGFDVDAPPFVETTDGYAYQGDEGVRLVQIASSSYIAISEPGNALFDDIPVANNHIEASAAPANVSGATVSRADITDQAAYDAVYPEDYTITFGDINNVAPAGPNYSIIRRSDGALVQASTAYDPVVGVEFNGFSVGLDGSPVQGDQFVVRSSNTDNMLATVQGIANNIARFSDSAERAAFIADSLNNLDGIQETLLQGRARVGARLNTLDTTRNTLEASRLSNQEILSDIRDLDYAEAVSRLSFLSFVLEASQQSLVRVSGLSLFNFLR
jgi:flagellar hook-associated protein 3 FlgL